MKKQSLKVAISVGLISLGLASSADAALVGRLAATPGGTDYQAYYDTEADLTWLADANYAATSGYAAANANGLGSNVNNINANGTMGWQAANDWAAQLTVGGVSGWRLPTTLQPDASCSSQSGSVSYGYNCTGSEMGNLFYNVLGGTANTSIATTHNSNYSLFSNIKSVAYWSATEYAPGIYGGAWLFLINYGNQNYYGKATSLYGWAVHSGDVSTVPVPAAVWLFGSGLLGLIGVARRKKS